MSGELVRRLRQVADAPRRPFFESIGLDVAAAELVRSSGWAFLAGLVADQSVRSVVAWRLPSQLAVRTGVNDLRQLGQRRPEHVVAALRGPPALHRYPSQVGRRLHRLFHDWGPRLGGAPESLWEDAASAREVQDRLRALPGIGRKKAALGVLLLHSELGLAKPGMDDVPLAVDVHVRRVLGRCLARSVPDLRDEDLHQLASAVSPECPGRLSTPVWEIGARFCRPRQPLCRACPMLGACGSAMAEMRSAE